MPPSSGRDVKFEDIPEDEFEEAYRVNVFAMFRLCKVILPQMNESGSIINTASIQSFDPVRISSPTPPLKRPSSASPDHLLALQLDTACASMP